MVSRLDLDGTHSPMGLVGKILKAEPKLKIPVPIEELAHQLDIVEIGTLKTEGFEGGLITDEMRSTGGILVKEGVSRQRRRFTVGHELYHFLNPYHKPQKAGEFLCDKEDMRQWDVRTQDRAVKMEVEANSFSALLLMPPPLLQPIIESTRYTTLETVLKIHEHFDVSKEAAARAFAEYNPETIAIIIAKDGCFLRCYRQREFPWLILKRGDPIPEISILRQHRNVGRPSNSDATPAEHWIETERGVRIPRMFEQVMPQAHGFAMIQLKILPSFDEDYDPEENMTSKQRLQSRQARWSD